MDGVRGLPVLGLLLLAATPVLAQEQASVSMDTAYVAGDYRVFSRMGEPASLEAIVDAMGRHDVVFIGETHDDPTAHMLEARLLEQAWAAHGSPESNRGGPRPVALSLEAFERDVQPILNEYLHGLITEEAFLAAARPWPRYDTDYRLMVEFAKEHGLEVIAANAPRRYTNRVSRHGREALSDLSPWALESLPPLPYGQPSTEYRDQWIQVMAEVMKQEGKKCGVPVADPPAPVGSHAEMGNQLHSQALWDATMAWWISQYLQSRPEALVLHVVGAFHVSRGTGIPEHMEAYLPEVEWMTVVLRPVDDVELFEPAPTGGWGDFVVQTDRARTLEAVECRNRGAGKEGEIG